jgi:hypothetical protein
MRGERTDKLKEGSMRSGGEEGMQNGAQGRGSDGDERKGESVSGERTYILTRPPITTTVGSIRAHDK